MKILYFARYRQILGRGSDEISLPVHVTSIATLIDHLKKTDERIAEAFADLRLLRVAINQQHASLDANLDGATEVAFFPPVTGG